MKGLAPHESGPIGGFTLRGEAKMVMMAHEISDSGASKADDAAAAAPGEMAADADLQVRQEKLLDEAVQETFPASDPISVAVPRHKSAR
jgi:hypothetical protein